MKKNIGKTDKLVRIGAVVIFAVLGYTVSGWFYIPAVLLLVTVLTNFCGLYALLGMRTCPIEEMQGQEGRREDSQQGEQQPQ